MNALSSAVVLGQGANWLPAWLTPIWMLALSLVLGGLLATVFYGLLSILSFIPPLGKIADDPRRGVVASLVLGGLAALGLCAWYVPQSSDVNYAYSLILPLTIIGGLLGFATIYGLWHRTRSEWFEILGEGVIPYFIGVGVILTLVGLIATPFVEDPMQIVRSVPDVNLIDNGTVILPTTIDGIGDSEPDDSPFRAANLNYNLRSMSELVIESDKTILLADSADTSAFSQPPFRIDAGERYVFRAADRDTPPIPGDPTLLHIQNREVDPATVTLTIKYVPAVPEVGAVVGLALTVFLVITSLMVFRQAAPRVWALSLSTAKNEMAQPLYLLLLVLGIVGVVFFGFYPFNTLGDDIRLLKDSGVTLIMMLGMFQAVWSAGTTVSEEIEGRTALTVLSKPISRRSFILGKYAGIILAVLVLFVIISAVLLVVISYKPIYDARETSRAETTWQEGYDQVVSTIPVIGLYFMETMAIGAVAVALATRMPLLANFLTCFVIYVIGNLTSPLVAASGGGNELVGFVGKLIAVVVPNLNIFNVQAAVDTGNPIPLIYLAGAFNYLVCFIVAVWMVAMLLFEDRDLA